MSIKQVVILIGFIVGMSASSFVYAENMNNSEIKNNLDSTQQLKKVFLSKETREKIDQQREAYLNPVVEKKTIKLLAKTGGTAVPKKKRIYIPPKVNVSLVMVNPDGSRLVRVNDKYNRSPSKHIKMDFSNSTAQGVPVNVQGRTQVVPVGSTLLTRKNKLVKTYKLEQAKRKRSAPKTEQKAVKQRLEQVKMLQP
ncbi:MAG: hypothetical protein L3J38_05060 [Thiomicrorhabdus sp.]|nr:hypothetical protein [Thiomicrorhabdus sp.]